jgi:catechol 2,3-dioxygenase-like lactoylglutathione lyase family enzyme
MKRQPLPNLQLRHVIIKVADQDQALAFYTSVLGFVKTLDRRVGRFRWLTVASPAGPKGVELVLEPSSYAPARASQKALYDGVFPATILSTRDVDAEYRRLKALGVKFRGKPKQRGAIRYVFFDDTCGNFIVLRQSEA